MTAAAVRAAFATQSTACDTLGSPFMAQLMRLCATMDWPEGPVVDRIHLWQGDLTFAMGRADFHGRWVHWNPLPADKKD